MQLKFSIICFVLLFSLSMAYYAQDRQVGNKRHEPIVLNYSDSLVGTKGNDNNMIREVSGHVGLQQGVVHVTCDNAKQFLTANNAELIGNVIITQEDLLLKSARIFYTGNTGIAESYNYVTIKDKNARLTADKGFYSTITYIADFFGNVEIVDDSVKINSDTIQYRRLTRESFANGNVKIEDDSIIIIADRVSHYRIPRDSYAYGDVFVRGKQNNVILCGDSIMNVRSDNYTKVSGNPVLFQIDTIKSKTKHTKDSSISDLKYLEKNSISKPDTNTIENDTNGLTFDTLTIASKIMESIGNDQNQRFICTDSVEIVKGSLSARAQKAYYLRDREMIFLEGNPVVWYDSTQLYADTIIISVPNRKLSSIKAVGKAFAVSISDTSFALRKDQILGDRINIDMANDTIRSIISIGNSKSLYFMYDEKERSGASRVSADTIIIDFKESQPDNYIGRGGVFGEVLPEKDVEVKPNEVYLPGYKWSENKPKRRILKIRENFNQLFE